MKRLVIGILIGCFVFMLPLLAISEETETESVFKMTEGYFKPETSWPHCLICKTVVKYFFGLGDDFQLYVKFALEKGAESPCSRRGDAICEFRIEVVDGEGKIWELWQKEEKKKRIDNFQTDDGDIAYCYPGYIPKKAALGEGAIYFKIRNGEKCFFSFKIPIEIK